MGLFGVLWPPSLCVLVWNGSEQGFIDLFHFHCQFPPHTDTSDHFCLQAMFLSDLLSCKGSLPPKCCPSVSLEWTVWMLWCKCSTDHRWTDHGAVFGLSQCLGVKCFLGACCPVFPLGGHLESIGVVGSSDLGQVRMTLWKEKWDSCFGISWEYLR